VVRTFIGLAVGIVFIVLSKHVLEQYEDLKLGEVIIETLNHHRIGMYFTRNYHTIRMYFTTQHCIIVP